MKHKWSAEDLADLGKMTDQALSQRIGIAMQTVFRERNRRGIAAFKPPSESRPWTAEEVALLGTLTDKDLAVKTGRPIPAVRQKRVSLKIAPLKEKPPIKWSAEDLADLGKVADRQIAIRKGISPHSVWLKRQELSIAPLPLALRESPGQWTDGEIALFGTMTDVQVSNVIGRPVKAVLQKRLQLQIAAYTIPITSMNAALPRSQLTVLWGELVDLDQRVFFEILAGEYQERTGHKLTVEKLSKLTLWDVKQLQSWFRSPDSFHLLPVTARHHIWLAVAYSI